jgi:hypothetical protein
MMHRQPLASLASFASLSNIFPDYAPPNPKPVSAVTIEKQKQKIKITIVAKKISASTMTTTSTTSTSTTSVVAPSPTKKIKITIKKQPKEEQQQQKYQEYHFNDIAPPSSMFFKPYSDYIEPPPKCCRFFIDNRHCFLRSTDNACIDTITKKVFGFWNFEIGTNSKLLLLPVGDDDAAYEVCEEKEKEDFFCNNRDDENNDNHDIKTRRAEMRKKSDANRARLTGQPIALLRQKIALKYGMQIHSVPTK